jgi:hypothetical protein
VTLVPYLLWEKIRRHTARLVTRRFCPVEWRMRPSGKLLEDWLMVNNDVQYCVPPGSELPMFPCRLTHAACPVLVINTYVTLRRESQGIKHDR